MDSRAIFVLVTSEDCPHCKTFRSKIWDSLKRALNKMANLQLVDISLKERNLRYLDTQKYPADLANQVRHFPEIMISSGDSWNKALQGRGKLRVTRYEGQINKEEILDWVDKVMVNYKPLNERKMSTISNEQNGVCKMISVQRRY